MSTKIFISWGGDLSCKLGEALRDWFPSVLQYARPYFSPLDIEKGTKWDSEITKELESSDIGVLCLTRDNTDRPWILFEAGALSKRFEKSKVCTLLFNLDPTDIKGPLSTFQATKFLKEDFKRLLVTINNSAGDSKLEQNILDSVYDKWWPDISTKIGELLKENPSKKTKDLRTDRDVLNEILMLTRTNPGRFQAPPRTDTDVIRALFRGIELIVKNIRAEDMGNVMEIINEMDPMIAAAAHESQNPDLYLYYRKMNMRIRNRLRVNPFISLDNEEVTPEKPECK